MNILVTGANGQLGNEMRIVSKDTNDNYTFTDVVEVEGIETTILDITDAEAIRKIVKEKDIRCIVNCAAYTNVDKAESNEVLCRKLNAEAPKILAEAMQEVNGLLVQISTDYVFGGDPYNTPCREDQKGTPTGVYGKTKLEGERNIEAVGCDYVIIRTAWLYSEFGHNFVKTMLGLTATKPRLTVVFDQAGTPTYAYDLAVAIKAVLADYERRTRKTDIQNWESTIQQRGSLLVVRLHEKDCRACRKQSLRHRALPQRRVSQPGQASGLFSSRQDENQGDFRPEYTLLDGLS